MSFSGAVWHASLVLCFYAKLTGSWFLLQPYKEVKKLSQNVYYTFSPHFPLRRVHPLPNQRLTLWKVVLTVKPFDANLCFFLLLIIGSREETKP